MLIGSEFEIDESYLLEKENNFFDYGKGNDLVFLFSGRNAIASAINDIKKNRTVNKVYLPSYCCSTMVEPFLNEKIEIVFYDVNVFNGELKYNIDLDIECDIFLAMSYFGYRETLMDKQIEHFSKKGVSVIEDITHSVFSKKKYNGAHYYICSLRKWMPIYSGAFVVKFCGEIDKSNFLKCPEKYIEIKKKAMEEKKESIVSNATFAYREKYFQANKMIDEMVDNIYLIDDYSLNFIKHVDIDYIIDKRRKNTLAIEDSKYSRNLLFKLGKHDCPLFVPMIFTDRNEKKEMFVSSEYFTPMHWPKMNICNSNLFELELSFVCDQRYEAVEILEKLR